jgi:hypothetical protein
MKNCKYCKVEKDDDEFTVHPRKGTTSIFCKECAPKQLQDVKDGIERSKANYKEEYKVEKKVKSNKSDRLMTALRESYKDDPMETILTMFKFSLENELGTVEFSFYRN